MILIQGGHIYAPEDLGSVDLLVAGTKIAAIGPKLQIPASVPHEVVSCADLRITPGLIDGHVHIAGAGGEGGPATRTPELHLSTMTGAGVTSVVGCLGTDGYTRTVESLLMKAKALRQEGMSAWIYTGSYQVPPPTLTGDVARDLCYIEEVIGAGEIAISDRRSSSPTTGELIKLTKQTLVGGMLGAKAGIMHMHMGDERDPFQPIHACVREGGLSYKNFYPTHINRNVHIFEQALEYGKNGPLDITTGSYPYFPEDEVKPAQAVRALLRAGGPEEHITLSSDAGGSLPEFDDQGRLTRLEVGRCDSLLREIRDMVAKENIPFETALRTVTANPARILKLPGKGRLSRGLDADLVVWDKDLQIRHVIAAGQFMVRDGAIVRAGTFERP